LCCIEDHRSSPCDIAFDLFAVHGSVMLLECTTNAT